MSWTCYVQLLALFLLLTAGKAARAELLRFTTTSWDGIRINEPFNISWTDIGTLSGITSFMLTITDKRVPADLDDYSVDMGAAVAPDDTFLIWVPRPELFGLRMVEWTRDRLWHVSMLATGSSGVHQRAVAPDFTIALAFDEGMDSSTTDLFPSTSPTPFSYLTSTPTSIPTSDTQPTKGPEIDPIIGDENLSTGAKAGIGIGCGIIVLSVIVIFAILRHRRRIQERQLTLFSGSVANVDGRGTRSRVNIADMIPDDPLPGSPAGTRIPFLTEKNEPTPIYELPGTIPSPLASPNSHSESAELPTSTSQPAELPDNTSPASPPMVLISPAESEPDVQRPGNINTSMSDSNMNRKYDPVRGSYTGERSFTAMSQRPAAAEERPIYQSLYRPHSYSGPSRGTNSSL